MPRRTPEPKKAATARGYGHNHQQTRARLMRRHVNGTRCWWCNKPMYRDEDKHLNWDGRSLHADHPDGNPRSTTANRLLHGTCNEQRGAGDNDHRRPAITTTPQNQHETDPLLGRLVMDWP